MKRQKLAFFLLARARDDDGQFFLPRRHFDAHAIDPTRTEQTKI